MQIHTSLEAGFADLTATPQNSELLQDSNEVSTVVEVLEEGESNAAFSERWNPAHFGETPRKVDADGNPTIFWDESIEPPDPDDFKSVQEYEAAWQKWEQENSNNLIYAAESERVSPSQESSREESNYADCAKLMNSVKKDCAIASPMSQSTTTCATSNQIPEESISSPRRHHVSPLPLKESAWVEQITETAYPQYCESLTESNPNSSVWKTSPDCYRHLNIQEKNPEHILNRCSGRFKSAGTMRNGWLWERDFSLEPDGLGKDSYSLPRPGALSKSSPSSRPPGNTKSEAKAKKLGLIGKNEVFNPEWLEQEFGLPIGWTDPQECRAATLLLELEGQPSETVSTPDLLRSHGNEYFTSTHSAPVKEQNGEYSTVLKAISLWQPWASLIPLGLKHYETRSWKTNYRGKLLMCSTAKSTRTQYQQYLKICNQVELPSWNEINFPHGQAIAICDLVDCVEITPEFTNQQSQTEILCGNWQIGRYAWKLKNIQPITKPFVVKGKQGLFNVSSINLERYLNKSTSTPSPKKGNKKSSDCWYTPLPIVELVIKVLGEITLDPCADDGKHLEAGKHYTIVDDGLLQEWEGQVFMNPPFSCPGVWMKKLQAELESGRVKEAIALVPAATDTNWLSPVLKTQPVCFWKGRIKFLGEDYQPKRAARQSHVLIYWGENWERFKGVFEEYGFVSVPNKLLGDKQDSSPSKIISPSKNSPSNLLRDKEKSSPSKNISPSKKRPSGEGNGYIHWRTITKNGKQYPQAYYHWKEGKEKRSKYIPKKLLASIEEAEAAKRPVIEILKLLGVGTSPSNLLGDKENKPSNNDVNADISKNANKLLGDKWINNGEINISQGFEHSPSNLDSSPSKIEFSPSKRRKGDGSGSIHWRIITRGGKDYPQAYYHYEIWSGGDRLVKSSKYIPKRLLSQAQRLEVEKAPVKEILRMLGIFI